MRSRLNVNLVNSFVAPDSVAVSIKTDIGQIAIAAIYRSQALTVTQNEQILSAIKSLCNSEKYSEVIITGDFNMSNTNWVSGSVMGPVDSRDSSIIRQHEFMNTFTECGLVWYITDEITRRRVVDGILQESTLDQVLCTNYALVNNLSIKSPLGKSDHVSMLIEVNADTSNDTQFINNDKKHNWGKVTEDTLLKLSSEINWGYSSDNMGVENMWGELHKKLMAITDNVPYINPVYNSKGDVIRKVPWDSSALKRKRKEKDVCWSNFDRDASAYNLNIALLKQREYEKIEIKAKIKYEKRITCNLKHNTKSFFSYLRSKRKVNATVTSLNKSDGSKTVGCDDTADLLADTFGSVFLQEPHGPLPEECYIEYSNMNSTIGDLFINDDDVKSELKKLNIYKSCGPDDIHPKLLKSLSNDSEFVKAISELMRACATAREIPRAWKEANVIAFTKREAEVILGIIDQCH